MKSRDPQQSSNPTAPLLAAVALLSSASVLLAVGPDWWKERGAIKMNGLAPAEANDFAAINQGQLKQLATAAYDELEARLPSGAGSAVTAKVQSWFVLEPPGALPTDPTSTFKVDGSGHRIPKVVANQTNDFAAVNLGMLKNIAKPFYDKLILIGYAAEFPWEATGHGAANDYALANIGQAKNLFRFDLKNGEAGIDSDDNGLPDWWEMGYFGYLGVDPDGDPDDDGWTNLQEILNGTKPDFYNTPPETPGVRLVVFSHLE